MRAAVAAASEVWLPPGGRFRRGCAPHSLFGCAKKRMRRARWKRKRRFDALRCSGPPRDGGRRIGACSDLGLPSGTLGYSASLQLPSRGGWCRPRRGARTHLTSFSFRAFRFATRSLGGRRGRCPHRPVAEASINHRASGSENRRRMYPRPPRTGSFPKGIAFPFLTAARDSQLSPAGGRRSALAQTDPPKRFFSLDRARPVSLLARPKEKWGVLLPSHQHGCHSRVQWDAPRGRQIAAPTASQG